MCNFGVSKIAFSNFSHTKKVKKKISKLSLVKNALQPPNDSLISDEDSDSEEGIDPQHLTAAQLIALADFRMQNLMMRRMLKICKIKLIWKMRTIALNKFQDMKKIIIPLSILITFVTFLHFIIYLPNNLW